LRFAPEFIDKVRDANDIVEIIGQYTELKGSGHRFMGRCPFPDHSDKSPSFSVSTDQQFFFCFGCKKGGNVFHFLEYFNGLSFPEAIEFLARRASIPLPEPDPASGAQRRVGPSRDQKETMLKINKLAGVFYHQQLKAQPEDSAVKNYLVKRGLTDEIVEKFRLGVSLEEWQGLVNLFKSRKVPLESAEALGLIKPKRNSKAEDSHFDLFRDRLMFPIFSATSDVIGFGGRTLGDGTPKYLNSHDSPVFNKSKVLYGIHETGKFIRAQDSAIVVEGYMDAISLYAAGIKNVVAILGTAFTPDHAKILKRYTLNVTMLLDGDEAGLNGAERSLPILLEAGVMAKGFALPDKMDPDDYVRANGAAKLQDEVERAPELFTLLLMRRWMTNYHGSPSDKVRIVEEAASVLARMQNRQLQELYMLELTRQLDVDMGWVRRALGAETKPKAVVGNSVRVPLKNTPDIPADAERGEPAAPAHEVAKLLELKNAPKDEAFFVSLLLHRENLMRDLLEAGPEEIAGLLSFEPLRILLLAAVTRYRAHPENFASLVSSLTSLVDIPAVILIAYDAVGPDAPESLERRLLGDYLNAIKRRALKTQAKAIAGQLKGQTSADLEEKLEQFMTIQRDRQALTKSDS
jgi:DNA primase